MPPAEQSIVETPAWDDLEFRFYPTDAIYRAMGDAQADPPWEPGQIMPASEPLALPAAAAVLSYGCGIIEGLKARRSADGRVLLFRPQDHGQRFARSAERLLMLPLPVAQFVSATEAVVRANARFVPPAGRGTFYLRPMQHGIDPMLGLSRGRRFVVTVYGCPVGAFGRTGQRSADLRLKVVEICRAAPGGTGRAKAIGNYPGSLLHKQAARVAGFDDVLYLDAAGKGLLQETSGANVFCRLRSGTLVTPEATDTILEGITCDSVMQLARAMGIRVEQRPLLLEELLTDAVECFCTGTAWTVRSVAALGVGDREHRFEQRELARSLAEGLAAIQRGEAEDRYGWTHEVVLAQPGSVP